MNIYAGYSNDRLKVDKDSLLNMLYVFDYLSMFNYYPNTSFCKSLVIQAKNEREKYKILKALSLKKKNFARGTLICNI